MLTYKPNTEDDPRYGEWKPVEARVVIAVFDKDHCLLASAPVDVLDDAESFCLVMPVIRGGVAASMGLVLDTVVVNFGPCNVSNTMHPGDRLELRVSIPKNVLRVDGATIVASRQKRRRLWLRWGSAATG